MRKGRNDRVVKIGILAALLAVGTVVVASATFGANDPAKSPTPAGTPAADGRPTLAPMRGETLRVRGAHFKAGERVRVSVDEGDDTTRKMVTASPSGTFVVSFPGASTCNYTIVATGDEGSRTSLQFSSFVCD
jgi:hypothetical protein